MNAVRREGTTTVRILVALLLAVSLAMLVGPWAGPVYERYLRFVHCATSKDAWTYGVNECWR